MLVTYTAAIPIHHQVRRLGLVLSWYVFTRLCLSMLSPSVPVLVLCKAKECLLSCGRH